MSDTYDEISLRDLYLIVKRGLPLILAITLLSALAAFLFVTLRTERFQAETTVLINPTPVRVQSGGTLALDQRNDMSWETYQTIAYSRAVLEDAIARIDGADITVAQLRGSGNLTRLVGPQRPDQVAPLTISHAFIHTDQQVAASAADAWAAATVETVGASMIASLETVRSATDQQLDNLEERLSGLEERWLSFQSRDESTLIEARLLGLGERIPETEAAVEQAARDLAAARGAGQALASLQEQSGARNGADPQAAVALLAGHELLPPETVAELTAALRDSGAADAELVTLVRQVELQRLTAEQAGLTAQRDAGQAQLEQMRELGQELRERQAGLVLERNRLQQQLDTARDAHADLAGLQPVIEYIHQLAPTNSRILNSASIPTDPVGPRRLLVTALAAVVGGMLALLYVFLRAAVSEPAAAPAREPVHASPAG